HCICLCLCDFICTWSSGCFNDLDEVARLQRGTAHEAAIYIGVGEKLAGVGGVHAPGVQNGYLRGGRVTVFLCQLAADKGMHFLRLVGRCGLACTDRPYRLIGNDDLSNLRIAEVEEAGCDLFANQILMASFFPHLERLSATEDRC